MFRGISYITVDTKGRLAMPAKYRDELMTANRGQLMVTVDHKETCLLIYPMDQWLRLEESLNRLPNVNSRIRNMQRLLVGHASELELDAQGRVLLPAPLREYAKLEKQAVLIGQLNKFELWDAQTWESARDGWLKEARDSDEANDILDQVFM